MDNLSYAYSMIESVRGRKREKWQNVSIFTFTNLCEYYVKFFFLSADFNDVPEVNILLFREKELVKSFKLLKKLPK